MKLYLVRHGDYIPKDQDPEKPLSDKGRSDVERVAALAKGHGATPTRIFHSGVTRAEQSAEIIHSIIAPEASFDIADFLEPNSPVAHWGNKLEEFSEDTILVGHLPYMSLLINYLTNHDENISFSAGQMVCLNRITPGNWEVLWIEK